MTNDLNPCPFCGGKAKQYHRDDSLGWGYTDWIACVGECGAATALYETKQEAVIAWNDRADRIEELEAELNAALLREKALKDNNQEARDYLKERSDLKAKLAKAVKFIELAVELVRWDLNPSFRDEMIDFTTELKGQDDE